MANVFIFFRDYRIQDNVGLNKAMMFYEDIIPIFVFTPQQIEEKRNKYFSSNSVQFLCQSLEDLNDQIERKTSKSSKLHVFYGDLIDVLETLHRVDSINSIHYNIDYTPFAKKRTILLKSFCKRNKIIHENHDKYNDYLLAPVGTFNRDQGKPYTIYTPFKNKVRQNINKIPLPDIKRKYNLSKNSKWLSHKLFFHPSQYQTLYVLNQNIDIQGGRGPALKLLSRATNLDYEDNRDQLTFQTSRLSAYIKYGCLSIREVFHKLNNQNQHGLCDQIIWREFYYYIVYYFPDVLSKSANYQKKYDDLKWNFSKKHFDAWCQGKTGYPIVDACMRELNTTGYMHNRGRLISANFLNRMLGMDWRLGERYFAQKLIDYDPSVNNGNWQWIASTGVDPKPYFQRLFNPWLQGEKFDKQARYIKKWLPQLKDVPSNELHKWDEYYTSYSLSDIDYVAPIVDYKKARERSIQQYRAVL